MAEPEIVPGKRRAAMSAEILAAHLGFERVMTLDGSTTTVRASRYDLACSSLLTSTLKYREYRRKSRSANAAATPAARLCIRFAG